MRKVQKPHWMLASFVVIASPLLIASRSYAVDENPKFPARYVEEAPLPEGFPPPSEVGQIVEKVYPTTRSYSATGKGAFFKCFGYLTVKQLKMTAPVVVDYDPKAEQPQKPEYSEMPIAFNRMHFLLEKNSLDEPNKNEIITVGDLPKLCVVSLAQQGEITAEKIKAAEAKLQEHLKTLPNVKAGSDWRILVYNGPRVPKDKVYWEVQLPIEKEAKKLE
jgi:hypothetical protein